MATPTSNSAASTSSLAAQTLAQGPEIPSEYVPRNDRGEIDPTEAVTVTHGYGRVPHGWRNFVDRTLFVGGVARNVPYDWVQQVRKRAPGTILHTFRHDATDADFVRVCSMSPELLDPLKQAALLSAVAPEELVRTMGREAVIALCDKLLAAVNAPARSASPPTGRSPSDLAAIRAAAIKRPNP